MQEFLKTEIRFWDLLGDSFSFSLETYLSVMTHHRAILFMMLCLLAFMASDPSGTRAYVPLWASVVFWPIIMGCYILFVVSGVVGVALLTRWFPKLRVPMPIVGFLALIPTTGICERVVDIMSGGTFPYDFAGQLIFYFFSVQGVETVFIRFIVPELRKEVEAEADSRHLVVGGEKVDLNTLMHIEAREHHVHLTFEHAKSLTRARLSDIVAQTNAEDGMQPHRSWWVARDPAIRVERKNGRMFLRLRDNTQVPVARTRVEDVLNWLNTHVHPAE